MSSIWTKSYQFLFQFFSRLDSKPGVIEHGWTVCQARKSALVSRFLAFTTFICKDDEVRVLTLRGWKAKTQAHRVKTKIAHMMTRQGSMAINTFEKWIFEYNSGKMGYHSTPPKAKSDTTGN